MGAGPSASASKPGSGTGQPLSWEELKSKILEAIQKDEQPKVFEALLANVRKLVGELVHTN